MHVITRLTPRHTRTPETQNGSEWVHDWICRWWEALSPRREEVTWLGTASLKHVTDNMPQENWILNSTCRMLRPFWDTSA